MSYVLHHGDCLDVMRAMPDCSVDSIVTDPPYGLRFMGKKWDCDVPSEAVWRECLRVLKPGGHLLSFAGTRTQHRMAGNIEDAGFEIRDMIAWVYGSGFPKSIDVSKSIDKAAGAERDVIGRRTKAGIGGSQTFAQDAWTQANRGMIELDITAPATEAAQQWSGWGTALKPAMEPITMARKPLVGPVAANVLAHGVGGVNIDGCRLKINATERAIIDNRSGAGFGTGNTVGKHMGRVKGEFKSHDSGRWPANVIHDGSEEVLAGFPETKAGVAIRSKRGGKNCHSETDKPPMPDLGYNDGGGSAARFFYCAKASKKDRGEGNSHPTVKPTDLMTYLCRLVTPPGGVVLDPFMGSGSTGRAAIIEGFRFIGIERDADYLQIASARIAAAQPGLLACA